MYYINSFNFSSLNKFRHYKEKVQKGLSLIEAAMVLALSAIVVAGVIAYYQSASDNQKTEATISSLTDLISVIHSVYASQPNYQGISAEVIAKTGSLPTSMVDENNNLFTPGGSKISIGMGTFKDSSLQNYFNISFGVSNQMCPIMARLDLGSSLSGFFIGSSSGTKYTGPLNVADSESACENAPHGDSTKDQTTLDYEFH
ncbi:major structural subunit of bundle-forming pilus [Izhakiella capsodis]|uniref:Major structural subunit of bundle-forming pilus n=1 Tax=Izhakiella capsodis TaxID=1367852 RepID=A0A1I4W4L6_9GAMM|nr:type 4 pilus major pilin [Izhakiella capsodis]SFN08382.1 major structural subunit of bundle-forming pilus [Izhakiella capsodis]